MRSSSGKYYPALDHIRALAALMVFTWHFTHRGGAYPSPVTDNPHLIFLSIFDEGHTGVALFMCLSGYLFAKILDGREINFPAFIWNRIVRLFPLLLTVFLILLIKRLIVGDPLWPLVSRIVRGLWEPTWPNGGWSVTTELHFYLLLPILIGLTSRPVLPLGIVVVAITARFVLWNEFGSVMDAAYFTILGRIDQFIFGMLAYQYAHWLKSRHVVALLIAIAFVQFYYFFDVWGGYRHDTDSPIWIFLPTIEGLAYSALIAWYDTSFAHDWKGSRALSRVGELSYSIYLTHFFVVFAAADFIHSNIMDISNFYWAMTWSVLTFVAFIPIAAASHYAFERPWLRFRRKYTSACRG